MDYPNGFNIKSFPAGKTIAFSRTVAVWILIVFFLIITMCSVLLLGVNFKKNYPFLISVDPFTEDWSVVTYPGKNKKESVPQYQIIQEKLVHDFVLNWFTISDNPEINAERWKKCKYDECAKAEQFNPDNIECGISCNSAVSVFKEFEGKVLPQYTSLAESSVKWTVRNMLITPVNITQSVGWWQVYATIRSSKTPAFNVLIFIVVENDSDNYPATFGYHITNFNSYRIVNE